MHIERLIRKKPYETIEFVLRRHPLTFIPMMTLALLLLLVPIGVYVLLVSLFPTLFEHDIAFSMLVLSGSVYLLSVYLFMFANFIDFYLDLWIVTNDRIVDIEQFNLFSRTISELDLFRIQDVTTDVHGFFPTMFDYGTVTVKTASQNIHIIFKDVPRPNEVRRRIIELSDEDRKHHRSDIGEDLGTT
jgi:membrane protein YdbS with pleckstrin-like domain